MLEGYRGVFNTGLTMSGPTVFAEVIRNAARQAQAKQDANAAVGEQSYTILLILTDGAVTDIEKTKNAIREASSAPLSIVIVGIGSADFSAMQFLDDFHLQDGGRTKDIVKFVEFSRHEHDKQALTRETLDEIPDQLVGYFYGKGIKPLPPTRGSRINIFEDSFNDDDIDLSFNFSPDGQVVLADPSQATWNARSYGRASQFLTPGGQSSAPSPYGSTPSPYGAPSGGAGAYGGYAPSGGYADPAGGGYAGPAGGGYAPTSGGGYAGGGYTAAPAPGYGAPMAAPTLVKVRVPANQYPGMQLRVKNPKTGNLQVVTIPAGVGPGDLFKAQLS